MRMLYSSLILTASLLAAGLLALVIFIAARSRDKKSSQGAFALVGRLASVQEPLTPVGAVLIDGELWRAYARMRQQGGGVGRGRANVRVTGARGHLLEVEPVD